MVIKWVSSIRYLRFEMTDDGEFNLHIETRIEKAEARAAALGAEGFVVPEICLKMANMHLKCIKNLHQTCLNVWPRSN